MPTNARANPPSTASDGTNAPSSPPRMVRSTTKQYAKMPTNTPSTTWFMRSRMKLRRTRDVY